MRRSRFIKEREVFHENVAPFGILSFDHYLIENWDVANIKSEPEQQEDVVKSWLALGAVGRLPYHKKVRSWNQPRATSPSLAPRTVPLGIPQHLQTPQQRGEVVVLDLITMWVRTWFGNDSVIRGEADESYKKLCEHIDEAAFMDANWAFELDEELADSTGAPTATGTTPLYVSTLLRRYPDALDGSQGPKEEDISYIEEGNITGKQTFLMIVADKRACETGAVLLIGIDDFGEMLPQRLRIKADDVRNCYANWQGDGQSIDENFEEGDVGELDYYMGDDAWAPT